MRTCTPLPFAPPPLANRKSTSPLTSPLTSMSRPFATHVAGLAALLICAACAAWAVPVVASSPEPQAASEPDLQPLATLRLQAAPAISPRLSLSADGRFVAFESLARLLPADTNDSRDIYVVDRMTGAVTLESPAPPDGRPRGDSTNPDLSGDGRYIVFVTSNDLVGDAPPDGRGFIILRDRETGAMTCLNRTPDGALSDGLTDEPVISADGSTVAFTSRSTNLAPDSRVPVHAADVYIWRRDTRTLSRLSLDGVEGPAAASHDPSLSADGYTIAFGVLVDEKEIPSSVTAGRGVARRRAERVYVRDLRSGLLTRVGCDPKRRCPPIRDYRGVISGDGRVVAFTSSGPERVKGDDNKLPDIFLFDLDTHTLELVSRTPAGKSGNEASGYPAISADGRFVTFESRASDLVCPRGCGKREDDENLVADVFLFDRETKRVRRVSEGREPWWDASGRPAIDASGRTIVFSSARATGADDWQGDLDLYLWSAGPLPDAVTTRRGAGTVGTSPRP